MNQILEQKLPPELINHVLKFCRHPTADILEPLLNRHREQVVALKAFCHKKNQPDRSTHFEFSLCFFLDKKVRAGSRNGKSAKAVVLENKQFVNKYY